MRTTLFVLAIALAGCNSGQIIVGDIESADDVVEACTDQADQLVTDTFRVEFGATSGGCPWGVDDNEWPSQGVLTARIEQSEELVLEDALICDMEFTFAGEAGMEQDIEYDDNFLFLFNGVVLASSYRPWVEALDSDGIFRIYDWGMIVGLENAFEDSIPTYCVGDETDQADCDIPPPETTGPISLSFDLSITSELSYRAIDEGVSEFGFVTTGDNDEQIDCSHDPFYFDVVVPYIPL